MNKTQLKNLVWLAIVPILFLLFSYFMFSLLNCNFNPFLWLKDSTVKFVVLSYTFLTMYYTVQVIQHSVLS